MGSSSCMLIVAWARRLVSWSSRQPSFTADNFVIPPPTLPIPIPLLIPQSRRRGRGISASSPSAGVTKGVGASLVEEQPSASLLGNDAQAVALLLPPPRNKTSSSSRGVSLSSRGLVVTWACHHVVARALIAVTMEAARAVARSSPCGVSSSSRGLMVTWARRHVVARALIAWAGCCVVTWARRHVGLSSHRLSSHGLIVAWSRELVVPRLIVAWTRPCVCSSSHGLVVSSAGRRVSSAHCAVAAAPATPKHRAHTPPTTPLSAGIPLFVHSSFCDRLGAGTPSSSTPLSIIDFMIKKILISGGYKNKTNWRL
jgi:hypothetical protein